MSNTESPHSPQFRQQIVELVQAGRSASGLSRVFGRHITNIRSWVRKAGGGRQRRLPSNATERQELIEQRHKLRQVQITET